MGEPIIICPRCHSDIPLTESLAAPLLAATRRDYERRIADKDRDIAERAEALHRQQADLEKARGDLDQQVSDKVRAERKSIAAEESEKAKRLAADDLNQKNKELADGIALPLIEDKGTTLLRHDQPCRCGCEFCGSANSFTADCACAE